MACSNMVPTAFDVVFSVPPLTPPHPVADPEVCRAFGLLAHGFTLSDGSASMARNWSLISLQPCE